MQSWTRPPSAGQVPCCSEWSGWWERPVECCFTWAGDAEGEVFEMLPEIRCRVTFVDMESKTWKKRQKIWVLYDECGRLREDVAEVMKVGLKKKKGTRVCPLNTTWQHRRYVVFESTAEALHHCVNRSIGCHAPRQPFIA